MIDGGDLLMDYMIADSNKKRSGLLQKKIDTYRNVRCIGSFISERELLEKTWLEVPDLVLVYIGDNSLNAFSVLQRVNAVTPEVNVVFYSEKGEYAMDSYDKGADYFLQIPADDIQIGKLIFRYLGIKNTVANRLI